MVRHILKTALAVFLRRKFFTGVSLFGISLTLAILGAASSFVDRVFGAHPPETRADRTLFLFHLHYDLQEGGPVEPSTMALSPTFVDRYLRDLDGVERVGLVSMNTTEVTHYSAAGEPVDSWVKHTDAGFWQIFAFDFLEGGPFTARDVADAAPAAVINASTRRALFGDGPALGRTLAIGERRPRVVGVVADVAALPLVPFADVWLPYTLSERLRPKPLTGGASDLWGDLTAILLARTPADLPGVRRQVAGRVASLRFPDTTPPIVGVRGGAATMFETVSYFLFGQGRGESQPALLLGAIVGLMLLFMALPSLNLVNLCVSRIVERTSEIGVRRAFGATRGALLGQFLAENVLLTLIGGIGGLVGSLGVLHLVNAMDLLPHTRLALNLRVLGYGVLLALALGLVSGAYPAWRMSRLRPVQALRGRR